MVSHEGFRLLGYVVGLLGFFACICAAFWTGFEMNEVSVVKDLTEEERLTIVNLKIALVSVLVSIIFFISLLVGIFLKNVILVKIHKVYLLINIVLSMLTLAASFHGLVKGAPSAWLSILSISVGIGLLYLYLWIVNGVIEAIQHEREQKLEMVVEVNADEKEALSNSA
uniref:(northern house mosquito) hypothetical protein n=2 Tax=Culex pipiens TaxID=7175 RepID=A0A8D8G8M0_CULPI